MEQPLVQVDSCKCHIIPAQPSLLAHPDMLWPGLSLIAAEALHSAGELRSHGLGQPAVARYKTAAPFTQGRGTSGWRTGTQPAQPGSWRRTAAPAGSGFSSSRT